MGRVKKEKTLSGDRAFILVCKVLCLLPSPAGLSALQGRRWPYRKVRLGEVK